LTCTFGLYIRSRHSDPRYLRVPKAVYGFMVSFLVLLWYY